MKNAIARALKRLNLQSTVMNIPVFGKALYDGISEELNRVNDFKEIVKKSVVPNENMSVDSLVDYEKKYNLRTDPLFSDNDRIGKIIERASRNGNGGAEWLQQQIRKAGFDLYVIVNIQNYATGAQYGSFQFGEEQFGGLVTYQDPRNIPGEIVASSPDANIGGQYISYGDFQFGDGTQFGTLQPNSSYPVPAPFSIPSLSDYWGFVFFVSPFPDRLATDIELLSVSKSQMLVLKKMIIELKHVRNWAILQATTATLQKKITTDSLYRLTTDNFTHNVLSDL